MKEKDIKMELDGIGIVMYSPGAVKDIPIGYDGGKQQNFKKIFR